MDAFNIPPNTISPAIHNIIIDSISTINKTDYKVYDMTVLVENKEKLEKFLNDLLNLKFVQKVERELN